jgi:hypothetical protein
VRRPALISPDAQVLSFDNLAFVLSCFRNLLVAYLLEDSIAGRTEKLRAKRVLVRHQAGCCVFFSMEGRGSNRLDHLVDELLLCLGVQILLVCLGQASANGDSLCNG